MLLIEAKQCALVLCDQERKECPTLDMIGKSVILPAHHNERLSDFCERECQAT